MEDLVAELVMQVKILTVAICLVGMVISFNIWMK